MARQETGKPTNKVMAGSIGAAIATLIVTVVDPGGAKSGAGFQTALTTVITFAMAWFVPPASGDKVLE
jgi:hypothetical protein